MKLSFSFVALGVSLTAAGFAQAEPTEPVPTTYLAPERPSPRGPLAAPKDALELSVGTGYTQGFGNLSGGVGMPSVASPGVGVDLAMGYRINPRWAMLAAGQYQELTAERSSTARGVTGSVVAQYHIAPTGRVDPWLEVGVGYRVLWEEPSVGPTVTTHGLQLGRARLGLDFRADEAVSLGPVIGADATMFLFQDLPNVQTNISDPRVSTFVYAGLQGRFDIGGTTNAPRTIAKR